MVIEIGDNAAALLREVAAAIATIAFFAFFVWLFYSDRSD